MQYLDQKLSSTSWQATESIVTTRTIQVEQKKGFKISSTTLDMLINIKLMEILKLLFYTN